MDLMNVMREYALAWAPSGHEKQMAILLKKRLETYCDSVRVDRVGNVIGLIQGTEENAPNVMVFAHMDSLGFVVRNIDDNGFLRIERMGGIPEKVLPGLKIAIETAHGGTVCGVIGMRSHHSTPAEEKYVAEKIGALYVDLGAKNREEVLAAGVDIGCFATYLPDFQPLLGTKIAATAVDNRGGCLAITRIAERLRESRPACNVYLVGTVWEEFNLRGAMMAARSIQPDAAIALDVCLTGDQPGGDGTLFCAKVSEGPTLTYYNFHGRGTLNGAIAHPRMAELALKAAGECGIRLQKFASTGMLTDSAYLQLENEGVALVDMGFPARYTHTPIEVCDLEDIEKLSAVVHRMLLRIDSGFSFNRYDI